MTRTVSFKVDWAEEGERGKRGYQKRKERKERKQHRKVLRKMDAEQKVRDLADCIRVILDVQCDIRLDTLCANQIVIRANFEAFLACFCFPGESSTGQVRLARFRRERQKSLLDELKKGTRVRELFSDDCNQLLANIGGQSEFKDEFRVPPNEISSSSSIGSDLSDGELLELMAQLDRDVVAALGI